jgi:hypothetical protein
LTRLALFLAASLSLPASLANAQDMAGHDMAAMDGMDMSAMTAGALGPYTQTREASGTAWQPDTSTHAGIHLMRGDWMIMAHGLLNGAYTSQSGPRGDDKTFVSGMVMAMAKRSLANSDTVQLRAMLSPDPVMGRSGYPLLLASGETADGKTLLVDRQHPHDLFMELSASYSHPFTPLDSVYVYAGLPGEPAFGPPSFMHRLSAMDSPEAPISHHWLDSTHITFGVLTAGYVHDNWKLEVSRYRGREPDQRRYNIETGALDSTSARLSWNPSANWSLQSSYADQHSPEALEPEVSPVKLSASAIYTAPLGPAGGWWSLTAAFGRKSAHGQALDAYVLEAAAKPNPAWTVFAKAEQAKNAELLTAEDHHGGAYKVAKLSVGAIHDWRVSEHVKLGLGGLYTQSSVPSALKSDYGQRPHGTTIWLRLKVE